jgi:hypothetical protein
MRRWLVLAAFVLAATGLGAAGGTTPAVGESTQQDPPDAAAPSSPAASVDPLFTETSALRELPIRRPVSSRALSRGEVEQKILQAFKDQTTPDEIRASELALKTLGLAPPDLDLGDLQLKLLTEQLAGLYDPKAREFYLASWVDPLLQRPVIVHELTHALQDQHFELRRLAEWPDGDSDAQLAAQSLVEGDATLLMAQYVLKYPEAGAAYLQAMVTAPKMPVFENAPRAIRDSLTFPFVQGMQFATALHGRGGWKAVTAAYTPLPQSTEQILHLEKFDRREQPVKVTLADVAGVLGRGWRRLDSDVSGEAGYQVILDQFLNDPAASHRAAAGWGGDRFAVYERAGDAIVIQMTVWDTETDAREFADAYEKRTAIRYPQDRPAGVMIERRALRVLVVEGLPSNLNRAALTRALWR